MSFKSVFELFLYKKDSLLLFYFYYKTQNQLELFCLIIFTLFQDIIFSGTENKIIALLFMVESGG